MAKKPELKNEKTEEQKFQAKYMEYNLYKEQMHGLSDELSEVASTGRALLTARETLENFGKVSETPDILVPIGAQVFAHARLNSTKDVLVNVGSGVILKKEIPKALEALEQQQKELSEMSQKIESQIKGLGEKMESIEPELEAFAQRFSGKEKLLK